MNERQIDPKRIYFWLNTCITIDTYIVEFLSRRWYNCDNCAIVFFDSMNVLIPFTIILIVTLREFTGKISFIGTELTSDWANCLNVSTYYVNEKQEAAGGKRREIDAPLLYEIQLHKLFVRWQVQINGVPPHRRDYGEQISQLLFLLVSAGERPRQTQVHLRDRGHGGSKRGQRHSGGVHSSGESYQ